jgi:hypothetical protein
MQHESKSAMQTFDKSDSSSTMQRAHTYGEGDVVSMTTPDGTGLRKSFNNRQIHVSTVPECEAPRRPRR